MGLSLEELKKMGATPVQGMSSTQMQAAGATKPKSFFDEGLDSSMTALGSSQSMLDRTRVFQTPLTEIAGGHGDELLEGPTGGIKQALKSFFSAGAQNAGPVGQGMLANAPEFAQNIEATNKMLEPTNTSQAVGMAQTQLAEMLLGSTKAIKTISEGTGLSKFFAGRKEAKELKKTIDAITPKLTSGEMEEAGAAGKVFTPKRGAPKVDFSGDRQYQEIAKDVKGVVEGKDPNIDIHNLRTVIADTSEQGVKPHLSQNKVPFNFEDFQNKMKLVKPTLSLKRDPSAAKTYDYVRDRVVERVYGALKGAAKKEGDFTSQTDFNDVWNARKLIDDVSEEELKTVTFGTPEYTGAKAAIQDMRGGLSDFIKDSLRFPGQMEQVNKMEEFIQVARARGIEIDTPEQVKDLMKQMGIENTPDDLARAALFESSMKKISNFYKAIDNVKTKIPDYIKENSSFAKRNPNVTKGLTLAAGAGVGTYAVNKVTGD